MDLKVYKKETVTQPGKGTEDIYVPNIIDLIPEFEMTESTDDIKNNIWSLKNLKRIADVKVEGNKLIINSDKVTYKDGNLYATILIDDELLSSAETVDEEKDVTEQECALATIWQRGLDPLDVNDGNRWSELYLGEISVLQIMDDIVQSVGNVTSSVQVEFDTVTDAEGREYLTYKLKAVA